MKDYLREFWRGTWHPSREMMGMDETSCEKEKLQEEIRDIQHKLSIDMDQGQLTLFVQYDRQMKALMHMTEEEGFVKGCSFMSKLLLSSLSEDQK